MRCSRVQGPDSVRAQQPRASRVLSAALCIVEKLERRALLAGSLSGTVWTDRNTNGIKDATEPGASGWIVYLDQNQNRQRDLSEQFTTTDANGAYSFAALPAGAYYPTVEPQSGGLNTSPLIASASWTPVGPGAIPNGQVAGMTS